MMRAGGIRLVQYRTTDGIKLRLEVSIDLARALDASDHRIRRNNRKWREHTVAFTDLAKRTKGGKDVPFAEPSAEDEAERRRKAHGDAEWWEGPKPGAISLVVGSNLPWPAIRPKGGPCPGCLDEPLPYYAACLVEGCNRTGLDLVIPALTSAQKAKARRDYQADPRGLAGGVGKAPGRA